MHIISNHFFLINLLCILLLVSSNIIENYPAPFTKYNRVLGFILAYNYEHIDPFVMILNEYVSMCEGGWDPTMVIHTTVNWTPKFRRYLESKLWCYRTGKAIDLRMDLHDPSISISLAAEHRVVLGKELENFDVFIYHEDDIVFRHSHLSAYLYETKKLNDILPETGLKDYLIGFQRYRRLLRTGEIHSGWGEQDMFEQDLLEELPSFNLNCLSENDNEKKPYLRIEGNKHQAMWVLTQKQVKSLQIRCAFLNQSNPSREYMSSFSLFDMKNYHCGMVKLIPAERLSSFVVLHYYQQRHVSWIPVFGAVDNLNAGFHFASDPKIKENVPDCWKDIVKRGKINQNITEIDRKRRQLLKEELFI